jgi:hypothetical protein
VTLNASVILRRRSVRDEYSGFFDIQFLAYFAEDSKGINAMQVPAHLVKASAYASLRRERTAAVHREAVLLAIAHLRKARSGEILDYINNQLGRKISKRAVQDWLTKLELDGFIVRNKYQMCSLADRGKSINLFAETSGKINFKHLSSIPLPGPLDKDLEELIRRFGFLIVWHFLSTVLPDDWRKNEPEEDAFILSWIQDSIPLALMFEAFMKRFGSRTKNKFYPYFMKEDTLTEIFSILIRNHQDTFGAMMEGWSEIMTDVLNEQKENPSSVSKELGRLIREERKARTMNETRS